MSKAASTRPVLLMTGASGLLGTALADRLARDYSVVGLDVVEPPAGTPMTTVHHMDVTSDLSVRDALRTTKEEHGDRLAAVVHLAAYYDFSGEESPLYDRVTVEGTERLLRHLDSFKVERFVFSSTMLVHGPVTPGRYIDEDAPVNPRWAYPRSKVETEARIAEHRPPVPHTLLRMAGVYTGYGTQPTLVQQIKRIYERDFESIFFPGDSSAGQSLVHIDDAVDAIERTLRRRRALPDGAILVGEPEPLPYAYLQDTIGRHVWGSEWPTIYVPETLARMAAWVKDRASEEGAFIKPFMIEMADDHYALDIGRARRQLGWEPRHTLAAELPGIIERLMDDPKRWYERNGLEFSEDAAEAAAQAAAAS